MSQTIKGAVKAEAGSTSNPHTASSHTVPPPKSAAAVIHSKKSALVRVKPEVAESTIPSMCFALSLQNAARIELLLRRFYLKSFLY
jgi:hypothetical protein